MTRKIKLILSRQYGLIGAYAAIALGGSLGGLTVAVSEALQGRDAKAMTIWNASTAAMVAGCAGAALAGKAKQEHDKLNRWSRF